MAIFLTSTTPFYSEVTMLGIIDFVSFNKMHMTTIKSLLVTKQ